MIKESTGKVFTEEVEVKKMETKEFTIVETLLIQDNLGNILDVHSNYNSYKTGKEINKKEKSEVFYLGLSRKGQSNRCIGLTVEDVKILITSLQSVVDYIEV